MIFKDSKLFHVYIDAENSCKSFTDLLMPKKRALFIKISGMEITGTPEICKLVESAINIINQPYFNN